MPDPAFAGQPVAYSLNFTNNPDTDGRETIGVTIRLFLNGQVVNATVNQTTGAFTVTECSVPDPDFPDAFLCPNLVGTGSGLSPTFSWNAPTLGVHDLRFDVYWRMLPTALPFGVPDGIISPTFQTVAVPPPPIASIRAADPSASEASLDPGILTVSLDTPAPQGLEIGYTVTGTAASGEDYVELSGFVTIDPNGTSAEIILTPIADQLADGGETVVVTLDSGSGYQLGPPNSISGTVTIADIRASIQGPVADAAEDATDARRFTVYLDGVAPPGGITVNYAHGGTNIAGDYTVTPPNSVTIPENQTRAYITLTPIADDLPEGREEVVVRVLEGTNYGVGSLGSATLGIADKTLPGQLWKVLQIVASEEGERPAFPPPVPARDHVCALLSNGTVKCWGTNHLGQLGLGDTEHRGDRPGEMGNNLPAVDLGGGRRAVELAAGKGSVCAILDNGDLKCWGENTKGQLGQGDTRDRGDGTGEMGDSLPPVNLGAGLKAVQLAMGVDHSCALLDNGTVKCWGWNAHGQLGLGDRNDRLIPAGPVDFGEGPVPVELAAMNEGTCARLNDGSVKCWGKNEQSPDVPPDPRFDIGQLGLGQGDQTQDQLFPAGPVNLGTGQRALKLSGIQHGMCVQLVSGGSKCWGENSFGVLGQGDTRNRGVYPEDMGDGLPVIDLGTGRRAIQISSRVYHVCVLLDNGSIKCWGSNDRGELGLGDTQARGDEPDEMGGNLLTVDLGTSPPAAVQVIAGGETSCARFDDGRMKCWGGNSFGQLGLGDTLDRGDETGEMGDILQFVDLGGPIAAFIQATDPNAAELGPETGQFTVTLSSAAPAPVTVNYTVGGTATNGVDYQMLTGSVIIRSGQVSAAIVVMPIPDGLPEGAETVMLTLQAGTGYFVVQPNSATVVIADSPPVVPPVATVQAIDPNAGEVGPDAGEFMVSLSSPVPASGPAVPLAYFVAGTAANGVDYQTLSGVVTIPPGQSSASIPVIPIPDTLVEGLETVTVTFQPGTGEESSATVTITDTPPPLMSVAATVVRAAEKGRKSGAFTFTLTQPAPAEGMTLAYSVGGTATAGNDYVPLPGTLSIPPGDTTVRLSVRPKNDSAKEGPESVVLTLRPTAGYQLGTPLTATVTIEDDDARRPPPNDCEANQLEEAVRLNREFAACARTNLRTHDDPAYLTCTAAAEIAFAGRYDRVMATLTGCQLTLPGSEVAGLWGDQIGTVTDPLVSAWHVQPSAGFRPAARSRRFITVSKVVERGVKNALKAEIRFLRDGGNGQRLLARAGVRAALAGRIRNLASERPDYTGPGAGQYASRVDQAVDNLANHVKAPTRLTPIQVALGDGFGCARFNDLTVRCWGANGAGQLGLADTLARGDQANEMADNLPVVALGTGRRALELAVGDRHVCARLNDGSVKCWGDNNAGQLGLGDMVARGDQPGEMGDNLPAVDLGAGRSAVAIRAGAMHTCALLDNGAVKCWGSNGNGELGLGDTSNRGDQPGEMGDWLPTVDFGPGRWAVELAAGSTHTCARLDDGWVRCWGQNLHGALGLGDTENRGERPGEMGAALPAVDLGAGGIAELAAGGHFTCARFESGRVSCWGRNDSGQLGVGDTADRGDQPGEMGAALAAVDLGTGRGALGLALGFGHACARLDDESLKCWGLNAFGQLGLGDSLSRGIQPGQVGDALAPTDLGSGRRVAEVAAGRSHTCARLDNATVKCWGSNSDGALGLGDTVDRGIQAGQMGDSLPAVQLGRSATTTP